MSKFSSKEVLKFLPLFIFYVLLVGLLNDPHTKGDENRYLGFANNLLKGYYAVPGMKVGFLWNGPGYPIILTPFEYFHLPLIFPRLLNVGFLIAGVIYLYKSLLFYIDERKSFIISILCGLTHPYVIFAVSSVLTEGFSFFLISAALYYFLRFYKQDKWSYKITGAALLGYLVLTKVFFFYVLLLCLCILVLAWLGTKFKFGFRYGQLRFIKLILYALVICIPYLIYTYSITGKMFYLADSGGSSLYCMSTPYDSEYGDWFPNKLSNSPENETITTTPKENTLYKNHSKFLDSIANFNGLQQDEILKSKAIANIKHHKVKYFKNIIYNFGRLGFRYPFTNREVKPIFLIVNIIQFAAVFFPFILLLIIACFKKIEKELYYPIVFLIVYIGGTLLVSTESRFIFPVYPIVFFLIGSILIKRSKFIT